MTSLVLGIAALGALAAPGLANAAVTAPRDIIAFPSRDFVSATGYAVDQPVTVEIQHPSGALVGTVRDVAPKEDPATPGLGTVEVNHPGGACWQGVTPDIRSGDVVRITNQVTGAVDTGTVRNVTATRPVQTALDTVQIHGTARDAAGNPLPIGELEQRLVAPNDAFLKNGRRTLRATSAAGSDGTLSYDGAGSVNWTATYTGLLPADVTRAVGAESRGMWIDPALPSTESTVFENGAAAVAGPGAPCTAPLEKLPPPPGSETVPPSDPSGLTATAANSSVSLSWTGSTDNVGVVDYGVYRDGVAIGTVQNADGSANPPTTFVDKNVPPGTYKYTVDAGDAIGNRSGASNAASAATAVNPAGAATNDPPVSGHGLIGFPARDFISATGYTAGATYRFAVVRGGNIIATSTPVVADSTGLAEVNHPGGACWEGVTPNIKPGDAIRIIGPSNVSEQTTIGGVTAERPVVTSEDGVTGGGTIEVHGTAQNAAGAPLPLDQIEQRLIAPRDLFDINGRRSIRAGAGLDGTLAYDGAGSTHWTAKYTLQTPDDLARAVGGRSTSGTLFDGAESRILWLGRTPAAGTELTIYENGPAVTGGPAAGIAGCTSGPAETPSADALLSAAPKFGTTAVGSTSTAQTVTLTNGGSAPLRVDRAYLGGLNPADYTITANTANGATLAPGDTVTVSVAFRPKASGTRQANLSFADDAPNTTDQTVALSASTPPSSTPTATAPVQSLAAVFNDPIALLSPIQASTLPVDLTWTGKGTSSELQMATGNTTASLDAFTAVDLTPASATSTRVRLAMGTAAGKAYQFRVRSCTAGVCGAWANGPKFMLVPADEGGMGAGQFKGTWSNVAVPGAYGGAVKRASTSANATLVPAVTFTVSGNAAWVSTLGPDQGLAQVQVDNGSPQVVDLYAPTFQTGRVVWARDALAVGTHSVTLTVLGKKSPQNPGACNTGAKCAQVDVDLATIIR